jgi:general secretion pathway protein B
MSYILDALRKSDQQRRLGGVPTLPSAPALAAAPERAPLLLYGLFALTLIVAALTTVTWLRPWSPEPAMIAITAAKPPPLSPPPLSPPQLPPRQVAPVVLPPAPAAPVAEAPPRAPAPAVAIIPAVVAPVAPRKPSASPAADMRTPAPVPVAARPARAAIGKADEPAGKTLSDAAPQARPVTSSALPASIRKQLPPLSVAVHAYSDTPQDRLVSINGRMLREGDTLAPDLRLEQITPDGMIFTYRGYRFQRAAQ